GIFRLAQGIAGHNKLLLELLELGDELKDRPDVRHCNSSPRCRDNRRCQKAKYCKTPEPMTHVNSLLAVATDLRPGAGMLVASPVIAATSDRSPHALPEPSWIAPIE